MHIRAATILLPVAIWGGVVNHKYNEFHQADGSETLYAAVLHQYSPQSGFVWSEKFWLQKYLTVCESVIFVITIKGNIQLTPMNFGCPQCHHSSFDLDQISCV